MADTEEIVIEPSRKFSFNFRELWHYKELFYFFTWRDVKVKYKQTVLGILWVVLQPLLTVLIFSLFFGGKLKDLPEEMPYPIFVFSGLLLWNIFSSGITNAGNSMVTNSQIIKKIYFPRLIIPISAILVSLIDFMIAFVVFIILLIYYQIHVDVVQMVWIWPLAILFTILATLGPSCWLAALNVKYRDFRYLIPFLIQAFLFLTPIIYPVTSSKHPFLNYILALNPLYGTILVFRIPFTLTPPDWHLIEISLCSSIALVFIGIFYFRKTEAYFADLA